MQGETEKHTTTNRDFTTEYKTGQVNQTKKRMYELNNKSVKIHRIRNSNKETAMIQRKFFKTLVCSLQQKYTCENSKKWTLSQKSVFDKLTPVEIESLKFFRIKEIKLSNSYSTKTPPSPDVFMEELINLST